ncbi:MAG: RNA repair transcriptional activator RtcR [Candidatus Omnitrophica bacterium]|nr:RNA repair transcriptional activator RtcR [Candidatus Omnitrophota bacterium]
MHKRKIVVIGQLGTTLDRGEEEKRWSRWRPSVALCQHEDLLIHRFELIYQKKYQELAELIAKDISYISPETEINLIQLELRDAWNFEDVFNQLLDFSENYPFNTDKEDYYIHITTGTHVTQICQFLLTEARYFPAKLIQTGINKRKNLEAKGTYTIIDLDLSRYDKIAQRYAKKETDELHFLKSGIETKNKAFNQLISQIEKIAIHSKAPFLLMGPTGAGKSKLARRIHELKKLKGQIKGLFVEINCATLKGEMAASTLFGHIKGSFTGAVRDRSGLLKEADQGILFLDEIGELGLDEQAMLLKALEEKTFLPVGSDKEISSNFQLIAGTNKDLHESVAQGLFREDLMTRINLWTFRLPALKDRPEDIEVNIHYELNKYAREHGKKITFNKEALTKFLKFARSLDAVWMANFRDLNASIIRLATLSVQGRIQVPTVTEEINRLKNSWRQFRPRGQTFILNNYLSQDSLSKMDHIEKAQLAEVLRICLQSNSLSQAGRKLFDASRYKKKKANDADRLRKYLAKYSLKWQDIIH